MSSRFTIRRSGIALGLAFALTASLGAAASALVAPINGSPITNSSDCPGTPNSSYSPLTDPYSPNGIAQELKAGSYYNAADGGHYYGQGADVALIDSGVARVAGLDHGNVVPGPDFSFEAHAGSVHSDGYGHGTHGAGIINGLGPGGFMGIAPLAKILDVRVADANGAVDVTQIIAAILWVAQHPHYKGLNIRVINLAFGLATGQDYRTNALARAAETAKKAGIVVIVAAGNDGNGPRHPGGVSAPGNDPNLLTIGSYDNGGTPGLPGDDRSSLFSSGGGHSTYPDVIAPGEHVMSFHVRGSHADVEIKHDCQVTIAAGNSYTSPIAGLKSSYPDEFVRGSGTSQATAVASGAVSVILSRNPGLSPDQVAELLRESARRLATEPSTILNGSGAIDLAAAYALGSPAHTVRAMPPALGRGTLQHARGADPLPCTTEKSIVKNRGSRVTGQLNHWHGGLCSTVMTEISTSQFTLRAAIERDIFGNAVDAKALVAAEDKLAAGADSGTPWVDNADGTESFMGTKWLAPDASSGLVLDQTDQPTDWTGNRWDSIDWGNPTFDGKGWIWDGVDDLDGHTWNGHTWTGHRWDTDALMGHTWNGHRWSGNTWRDNSWS